MRTHRNCFVGRDAVDWLVLHLKSLGGNRASAVELGRQMLALRLISHVKHEHDFEDDKKFYRFEVGSPFFVWRMISMTSMTWGLGSMWYAHTYNEIAFLTQLGVAFAAISLAAFRVRLALL